MQAPGRPQEAAGGPRRRQEAPEGPRRPQRDFEHFHIINYILARVFWRTAGMPQEAPVIICTCMMPSHACLA